MSRRRQRELGKTVRDIQTLSISEARYNPGHALRSILSVGRCGDGRDVMRDVDRARSYQAESLIPFSDLVIFPSAMRPEAYDMFTLPSTWTVCPFHETMLRVAHHRLGVCAAHRRLLTTLAIETSCDDTSVAVLEQTPRALTVHFHEKITANNDAYNGIHPLVALHSHRTHLALLVQKALSAFPRPDFIAATRGPGMRSNLAVGLDTAKGLALGLGVPFLGVHHMQAHTLTPRLVHAMDAPLIAPEPDFPFLTVLVSGGHTMLIDSRSLTEHSILAETGDIALGDCLDKAARAILPADLLQAPYGRALEEFAFPNGPDCYNYEAPARRQEELECRPTRWHWALRPYVVDLAARPIILLARLSDLCQSDWNDC